MDFAVGIVGLDRESACIEDASGSRPRAAFGLGVVDSRLAVDLDHDVLALHGNVVVEPLAIGARSGVTLFVFGMLAAALGLGGYV